MRTHRTTGHFCLMALLFIALIGGVAAILMLLWNVLIPYIIGWTAINYWQSLGLLVLCRLLFSNFGHHFGHGRDFFTLHREHAQLHEKLRGMTWDEKREYIRNRMAEYSKPGNNE